MPVPFTFDEELHICRDMSGAWIPSATQVIELAGLSFDFKKYVERDVLDRRCAIGDDVHKLTDVYDTDGDLDPTWVGQDSAGYVDSYIGWRRLTGFAPQACSVRMCELIDGLPLTGELDVSGMLGKYPAIIDKKTGSTASDSWGIQLALYEMLKFRSTKIGRVIRAVSHLRQDGSPGRTVEYGEFSPIDGMAYADLALMALHTVHARIRRGYLSERDLERE